MTALACDGQIFQGHLGKEEKEEEEVAGASYAHPQKATIRNRSTSDRMGGICTTAVWQG